MGNTPRAPPSMARKGLEVMAVLEKALAQAAPTSQAGEASWFPTEN